MDLAHAAMQAAQRVLAQPRGAHWLLACDTDADGLCAAAVAAQALLAVGHRFTVRADRAKDTAAYQGLTDGPWHGIILLDKGTSHAAGLAQLATASHRPILVVDHHNVRPPVPEHPGFFLLNPRACGLDGSRDASAATTAAALALALCGDRALAWAPAALAGAIGDWQQRPAWQGWNLQLLERARTAGHVQPVRQPRLIGADLAEALTRWRPPIAGLAGDYAACQAFLAALGIEATRDIEELSREEQATLVSALTLRLLQAGQKDAVAGLVGATDHAVRFGTSLRHLFRIVDACGREGQAGTGVAFLLGDASARAEAQACLARYKQKLVAGVRAIQKDGVQARRAVQVAHTASPDYTGMVAGLAMTLVLPDRRRPVCVVAQRPDGQAQVSTRGTEEQVKRGMDLGAACQAAATRVGREGGGHPVAAGAVVAWADLEAFLAALDEALVAQGFLEAP